MKKSVLKKNPTFTIMSNHWKRSRGNGLLNTTTRPINPGALCSGYPLHNSISLPWSGPEADRGRDCYWVKSCTDPPVHEAALFCKTARVQTSFLSPSWQTGGSVGPWCERLTCLLCLLLRGSWPWTWRRRRLCQWSSEPRTGRRHVFNPKILIFIVG